MFSMQTENIGIDGKINKSSFKVVVKNPDYDPNGEMENVLEFNLGVVKILKRTNQGELSSPNQFLLLNKYLDYKGLEFKKTLFRKYWDLHMYAYNALYSTEVDAVKFSQFRDYFNPVLEMFDLEDIRYFLSNVFKLHIPQNLSAEFDENIEKDNRGFKKQTYIQVDYQNLVDFIILIKGTYPLLIEYAKLNSAKYHSINTDKVAQSRLDYDLTSFYRSSNIVAECGAMRKLKEFTENLLRANEKNESDINKIIINKGLSEEEILEHSVAQVIIQKLTVVNITNTDNDKSIIAGFYTYIKNKLQPTGIVDKSHDPNSRDSVMENVKICLDLPIGVVQTANFFTREIDRIITQLPIQQRELIEKGIVIEGKEYNIYQIKELLYNTLVNSDQEFNIHDNTLILTGIIFKPIIMPRYIDYLDLTNILNLMALGCSYLFNLKFLDLMELYISGYTSTREDGSMRINTTGNKSRINVDDVGDLEKYFPLRKFPKGSNLEGELLIKLWVEEFSLRYYKHAWANIVTGSVVEIPTDIKVLVSKFLIVHEQLITGKKL